MKRKEHIIYNDDGEDPKQTTTYAAAYAELVGCAEKLRRTGPSDPDDLITDYRRAMAAYRICESRVDLIRMELNIELEAAGADAAPR